MTNRVQKMLTAKNITAICSKCGKPLNDGQEIISKSAGSHTSKRYHKNCLEGCYV